MKQLFTELKQIIDEMNTAATAMGFFPITLAGKEQPSAKAKVNKNALKEKKVNIKEENTMKEIIKTLLLEGIDEDTIHRVLDVIEEEYEVVDERVSKEDHIVAAKRAIPDRERAVRNTEKKLEDAMDKTNYKYTGDINIAEPKGWPYGSSKTNPETEKAIAAHKVNLKRRAHAKKVASGDFSKFGVPQEWSYKSRK